MAAPRRSRDAEQQVWVRTRFRNRGQSRHSPTFTQQGCSEEGNLKASQEVKPESHSHGQGGKPGTAVVPL